MFFYVNVCASESKSFCGESGDLKNLLPFALRNAKKWAHFKRNLVVRQVGQILTTLAEFCQKSRQSRLSFWCLAQKVYGKKVKGSYLVSCMGSIGFDFPVNRLTFRSVNSIGDQRACFVKLDLLTLKTLATFKGLRISILNWPIAKCYLKVLWRFQLLIRWM